jgi:hypothetical protein
MRQRANYPMHRAGADPMPSHTFAMMQPDEGSPREDPE